jgi:tyrosyl-tRNA synthetase
MALPFLLRSSSRPDIYICVKCTWKLIANPQRRWLGMKYLAKVADAEKAWQDQALRIRQKKEKSMLTILEERGLVQDITG